VRQMSKASRTQRLTISAADTDESTRAFYAEALAGLGHNVTVVEKADGVANALIAPEPDAVLVELAPPDKACRVLKQVRNALPSAFIAAVATECTDETGDRALRAGADAVLLKPMPVGTGPKTLAGILRAGVERRQIAGETEGATAALAGAKEDLARLGLIDGSTQAYNDRYLDRRLQEEVSRAKRYGRPLSIIGVDVDDFRDYIEAHGTSMGTLLLRQVVSVIQYGTRMPDAVCRREDDQFVVILPETELTNAVTVGEKVRRAVADFKFAKGGTQPLGHVSVSVGCAGLDEETADADGLTDACVSALLEAKGRGKDNVRW
jgi:diguanylate cyclase (GGDEF)-like protein